MRARVLSALRVTIGNRGCIDALFWRGSGGAHVAAEFGDIVPSRHAHAKVLHLLLVTLRHVKDSGSLTTVIGMEGALGKIKATFSNLPRRRQFCASAILEGDYG